MTRELTTLWGETVEEQQTLPIPELDRWLDECAPSSAWGDGYGLLRSRGVDHRYAALAVWLSLSRDDRGKIQTREEFANFMGVSRQTTYDWESKRPVREWAEMLRVLRLRGAQLAEVDRRTYLKAVDEESSAADRQLYYKRAGVWEDQARLTLIGDDGEAPVRSEVVFDLSTLPVEALRDISGDDLEEAEDGAGSDIA